MIDDALEMHIPRKGPAGVLTPLERRLPPPGPGEVRVAVEAAGVADADIMMRQRVYSGQSLPVTPGYDFVGRVEAVGAGVTELAAGQSTGHRRPRPQRQLLQPRAVREGAGVVAYSSQPWRDARPLAYRQDLAAVLTLVADGALSPRAGATYPLREAAQAQRALETRSVAGKIVLVTA